MAERKRLSYRATELVVASGVVAGGTGPTTGGTPCGCLCFLAGWWCGVRLPWLTLDLVRLPLLDTDRLPTLWLPEEWLLFVWLPEEWLLWVRLP
jgi:hypothetical protein